MHCPRCGQEQASEDLKFCSRCGFPLGLVAEILAHGGFLPQLADLHKKGKKWLTRNFGLKIAFIWLLFLDFIMVPFAAVTHAPKEIVAGFAIIGFCGALLIAAISLLFLPKNLPLLPNQNSMSNDNFNPQNFSAARNRSALPPQTSQPVSAYAPPPNSWKAPDTGDLVPRSVTEGTTKLLKKDE